ncbi:MAG: universal stress protein, partial [Bacteroidota bacterium]
VIETAAGLAHHAGAPLIAFHAVEPLILPAPYAVEMGSLGTDNLIADATDALDERLRERVTLPLATESVVREGSALVEILDLAHARSAGLIVQGSHGRTGIGRALLGSVAEAVAKRARCPVLTLRRGARPLAVTDRDALTSAAPLAREHWAAELEGLSFYAEDAPWAVSVGVVGLDARGQVLSGVRLRGLAYDSHDDAIDVLAEGCDHRIARPLAVRIAGGENGAPFTVEVVRRDGARERIAAEPLAVPA